jgi:ribokinase
MYYSRLIFMLKKNKLMDKILVIGSSNVDLIAKVENFPAPGETIKGLSFQQAMGGKGANQALAAHRTGGKVSFITSLGNDANGNNALKYYKTEGLDASLSKLSDNIPTGTAMIWVDKKGENSIVIIPGANRMLTSEYILNTKEAIEKADIIVLQMEIPYETIKMICKVAFQKKKKVILNVAPACNLEEEIFKSVYFLVVNKTEAEVLTGEKIEEVGEVALVDRLLMKGVQNIILTLGKRGCLFKNTNEFLRIPAFSVDVKDTTAAGDTFCGALVTGISKNRNMKDVLEFASAAAALSVTTFGAQPSIPTEKEINEFLKGEKIIIN